MLADLKGYIALAPLHQPFALQAIETLLAEVPDLLQVACFDTAFHRTLPPVEQMLPLPHALLERGIRRYGFHGLSYEYMAVALAERHGDLARGRTIVAHLGSGASLCAMHGLESVATTMGFSALDGLMMGTRCGAIDPGVLLHLMQADGFDLPRLTHLLYHESGLLGVSGLSASPQPLLEVEHRDARARAALELYVRRIVREIGALTAVLGGLDMLAFTAGVGEHSAVLRERICGALAWLGIDLDGEANLANAPVISQRAQPRPRRRRADQRGMDRRVARVAVRPRRCHEPTRRIQVPEPACVRAEAARRCECRCAGRPPREPRHRPAPRVRVGSRAARRDRARARTGQANRRPSECGATDHRLSTERHMTTKQDAVRIGRWARTLEELDHEVGRLAHAVPACRSSSPASSSACCTVIAWCAERTTRSAFAKLRDLLMMHFAVHKKWAAEVGEPQVAAIEGYVIERLRKSLPELGGRWPPT